MSVLLLRLAGPMQSWGVQSRFSTRDTGLEPSKSGVVGLLCAALGWPRDADVTDLAALPLAVRVDRAGRMACDYHTAGGERRPGSVLGFTDKGKPIPYGVAKADGSRPDTVVSRRFYLADADYLAALEGPAELLADLHAALARPVWPLYLGRKSFVPGEPVYLPDGLRDERAAEAVLRAYPWRPPRRDPPARLRLVLEAAPGEGEPRPDVPLSFAARRFGVRHVTTQWVETNQLPADEEDEP
jgi:CRISPR system Cascade subunit CasD